MSCGNPFVHMLKSARESLFDLPKHQHEYIDDIEMECLQFGFCSKPETSTSSLKEDCLFSFLRGLNQSNINVSIVLMYTTKKLVILITDSHLGQSLKICQSAGFVLSVEQRKQVSNNKNDLSLQA